MQITKIHKIILSMLAVLILLAIYIVFDKNSQNNQSLNTATNQNSSTTTAELTPLSAPITTAGSITTTKGGKYTIEQVPIKEQVSLNETKVPQPIPDLNRPVVGVGSVAVSSDAIVRATEKILEMQSRLKKNPSDLAAWVDLGIYQKMAGDYQGVVISWTYATKLNPSHFIAFANLGDFYAYFLKDNVKSEMYYKQAISKAPTQSYLYTQLADVYRYFFKDLDKARAIVEQGLLKIPNDPNLLQMKASLNQ